MSALDDPEVIKKAADALRKRHAYKAAPFLYYAALFAAAAIYLLCVYYLGGGDKGSVVQINNYFFHPEVSSFTEALLSNLVFLYPMLILVIVLASISKVTPRGLRYLQGETVQYSEGVRRLSSSIESVSLATGESAIPCLVMSSTMPNALTVIINRKPYLVVTSGLLTSDLTGGELTALVAHETAHIAIGDGFRWLGPSRLMLTLAALISFGLWWINSIHKYVICNFPGYGADLFQALSIAMLFFPIAFVIYFEIKLNQQDDLFADATSVMIARDPDALIAVAGLAWTGFLDS